MSMFRQRFRLRYAVEGDKRFLSHHDLMRLWLRALRRTGLPLRMTEGFHIRPRVSFAMARGVGIASQAEWLEFELSDWVNPEVAARQLAPQLPPGIVLREVKVVAPSDRAVVRRMVYEVRPGRSVEDLRRRVEGLLQRREVIVRRGGGENRQRQIDIRPLLVSAAVQVDGHLEIVAECRESGSLRPEEVLSELGFTREDIAQSLITRIDAQLEPAAT